MARRANLENKNIIITGASSGLGRAIAIKCANAGANLILSGRSRAELENTKALCGISDNLHIAIADVTEANDCRNLIDFGLSKFDSLDHLICSAGVSMWSRFDEVEKSAVFANLIVHAACTAASKSQQGNDYLDRFPAKLDRRAFAYRLFCG